MDNTLEITTRNEQGVCTGHLFIWNIAGVKPHNHYLIQILRQDKGNRVKRAGNIFPHQPFVIKEQW
jgi:hypothetical protein